MPIIAVKPISNGISLLIWHHVRIRVLFFGVLHDIVGLREESLDFQGEALAGAVFEHYAARFPRFRAMSSSVVLALNQQFSSPSAALSDGGESGLPAAGERRVREVHSRDYRSRGSLVCVDPGADRWWSAGAAVAAWRGWSLRKF